MEGSLKIGKEDQNSLLINISESVKILLYLTSIEEHGIAKYLSKFRKFKFKLLNSIKIASFFGLLCTIIPLSFLPTEEGFFLIELNLNIVSVIALCGLLISVVLSNIILKYSLGIYLKRRRAFLFFQKQLKLIEVNALFSEILQSNPSIINDLEKLHKEIDYLANVLKRPSDYFRGYYILGILGLIIPIFVKFLRMQLEGFSFLSSSIVIILATYYIGIKFIPGIFRSKDSVPELFKRYFTKISSNMDSLLAIRVAYLEPPKDIRD